MQIYWASSRGKYLDQLAVIDPFLPSYRGPEAKATLCSTSNPKNIRVTILAKTTCSGWETTASGVPVK